MITFDWPHEESLLLEGLARLLSPLTPDAEHARDGRSYWCEDDSSTSGKRWFDRMGNNWFLHLAVHSDTTGNIYQLSHRFVADKDRFRAVGWFLEHALGSRTVEVE